MPKLDELKEDLTTLRIWLVSIIGVFTAVSGWIITSYKTQDSVLLILASLFLLILFIIFLKINKIIKIKTKEIGKLKK